ncbi:MAG: hypothetical protein ABIJ40_00685 [Bacteroidota bacterium]
MKDMILKTFTGILQLSIAPTLLLILVIFSASAVIAQDDYKKWLEKDKQKLNKFLEEDDKKFVEFLKKDWEKFQLEAGYKFDKAPKPVQLPKAEPKPLDIAPANEEPSEIKSIPEVTPVEKPIVPKEIPPPPVPEQKAIPEMLTPVPPSIQRDEIPLEFDFYGSAQRVGIKKEFRVKIPNKIDQKAIAKFWEDIGSTDYKPILASLTAEKENKNLNDWGYFMLLKNFSDKVYPGNSNNQHLLIWFLSIKSGYKTQVGLINDEVFLFISSEHKLYGVPFLASEDKGYNKYVINFGNLESKINGSIYTYDEEYPGSTKLLDMQIARSPQIDKSIKEKNLHFEYEGESFTVPVKYNISAVNFYEKYPYTNMYIYFNSGIDETAKSSLLSSFKPIIAGKSEEDAANILLRFAQTAFEYQTDQPNFGREKPLFVEETLHYKFSDCEDRSILYAFLVKNLLGLDVIGLDFPGHISTAVKFNKEISGDYIIHNGKKYLVCDPTYINANIGMCMPQFKGAALESIIEISK